LRGAAVRAWLSRIEEQRRHHPTHPRAARRLRQRADVVDVLAMAVEASSAKLAVVLPIRADVGVALVYPRLVRRCAAVDLVEGGLAENARDRHAGGRAHALVEIEVGEAAAWHRELL